MKDNIVNELSDIEVLETIYSYLNTPIERRRHSEDFNKCVIRLGEYINEQYKQY